MGESVEKERTVGSALTVGRGKHTQQLSLPFLVVSMPALGMCLMPGPHCSPGSTGDVVRAYDLPVLFPNRCLLNECLHWQVKLVLGEGLWSGRGSRFSTTNKTVLQ